MIKPNDGSRFPPEAKEKEKLSVEASQLSGCSDKLHLFSCNYNVIEADGATLDSCVCVCVCVCERVCVC